MKRKQTRRRRIQPEEILEYLRDEVECATVGQIAQSFGVAERTAQKKLGALRKSGEKIIYGSDGYRYVEAIRSEETRGAAANFFQHLNGTMASVSDSSQGLREIYRDKRTIEYMKRADIAELKRIKRGLKVYEQFVDYIELDREING